jgi:hypothetical protein
MKGMCSYCARMDWDCSNLMPYTERRHRTKANVSGNYLDPENCRICRLFDQHFTRIPSRTVLDCFFFQTRPERYTFSHRMLHPRYFTANPNYELAWLVTEQCPANKDTASELKRVFVQDINWIKIKSWIADCVTGHSPFLCMSQNTGLQRLRVIDCNSRTVVSAPERCRFVALSYVWGDGYASALGSTSELLNFPLTVEDSLHATLALGYQYLWVDRYLSYTPQALVGI